MIHKDCLSSGLGHDFVLIARDNVSSQESWMECYKCKLTFNELEEKTRNCEHEMRCFKCGDPLPTKPVNHKTYDQ